MDPRRAVVPVAVLLGLVLVGGVAAVPVLRADERADERERAAAAYRDAVVAIAQQHEAVKAPLREALATDFDDDLDDALRYDVFVGGRAERDLRALLDRLTALPVPADQRARHDRLVAALTRTTTALDVLARPEDRDDGAASAEVEAFETSTTEWTEAATASVGTVEPRSDLGPDGERETRAGVLLRWGQACARSLGDEQLTRAGDGSSGLPAALRAFPNAVRPALTAVVEVPVPVEDEMRVDEELYAPLLLLRDSIEPYNTLADALEQRDSEGARAALAELGPAQEQLGRVNTAFTEYGSALCAGLFVPGTDDALRA